MLRSIIRRAWVPVLLTLVAGLLRFWVLDAAPPGFHYDEAFEALEAWRVLQQPGYHPIFFAGNFGVEPLFIYLTALAFRIFGPAPVVMRGAAALIGTLTVPALYGLGCELRSSHSEGSEASEPGTSKRPGAWGLPAALPWLAGLTLATMRWHILFSRVGIEPVLVPLCMILMLWAFWWALRTDRRLAWVLLGVAIGLGPYTYPAGRLLPVVIVALVLLVWLTDRARLRGRGYGLLLAACIALAVVAPLAWHFSRYPDQLILRSSQIAMGTEKAPPASLGSNALATLGMFVFQGDVDPRNNVPGLPVLDPWLVLPFCLGLAATLWRWRRPVYAGIPLAGLVMLAPTVLSEFAPHFRRAIGAVPSTALLAGLGLGLILSWGVTNRRDAPEEDAPRLKGSPRTPASELLHRAGPRLAIVVILLAGSTLWTIRDYYLRWGTSPALYYAYDEGLWEIGQFVKGLPAGQRVYLSPRPASDTTLAFAWRDGPQVRRFDGRHAFIAPAFPPLAELPAVYIIIEHEDQRGAASVRELYPQAQESRTFRDRQGRVYARAFQVPVTGQTERQPQVRLPAAWPGVELLGYDLNQETFQPGGTIALRLWWRATEPITTDWTVFTHLLGPARDDPQDGDMTTFWAGYDSRPGAASALMPAWQPGELILDEYRIQVPADAPPGHYALEVGLYNATAGNQRALAGRPAGQDHVILGQVEVQ